MHRGAGVPKEPRTTLTQYQWFLLSTSHPTPDPKPLPPSGWASLPFPQLFFSSNPVTLGTGSPGSHMLSWSSCHTLHPASLPYPLLVKHTLEQSCLHFHSEGYRVESHPSPGTEFLGLSASFYGVTQPDFVLMDTLVGWGLAGPL